jgi:two-component system alkaline phosphatase synthesis response regulator PhoP
VTDTGKRKIVVVDDEPFISRSLAFVLRRENYEVFEARDGAEALEVITRERPDLVFLDIMMPKVDGFEVTERVRADPNLGGVKIILLTAKGQDADRERGKSAGADEYMTKPFSPTKVLDRAREILEA